MIFVLGADYQPSSLLQFDLNGLSKDGKLLGLNSSRPEDRTGSNGVGGNMTDAAVDEEAPMRSLLGEFLHTTAVRACIAAYTHISTHTLIPSDNQYTGPASVSTRSPQSSCGAVGSAVSHAANPLSGLCPLVP